MANNVLCVLPASADRLPLQASDKLCRVKIDLPRDWEVRQTDQIRAVMVGKCLTQRCDSLGRNAACKKPQRQEQGTSTKEGWDHLFPRKKSDLVSTVCTALCAGGSYSWASNWK